MVIFSKEVLKLHRILRPIILDHDKLFINNFWNELFKLQGLELKMSTSYHSQIDGQSKGYI